MNSIQPKLNLHKLKLKIEETTYDDSADVPDDEDTPNNWSSQNFANTGASWR